VKVARDTEDIKGEGRTDRRPEGRIRTGSGWNTRLLVSIQRKLPRGLLRRAECLKPSGTKEEKEVREWNSGAPGPGRGVGVVLRKNKRGFLEIGRQDFKGSREIKFSQ